MNTQNEATPKQIASEFLLGELIKASTNRFKFLSVPWGQMKKGEQEAVLSTLEADIRQVVREAVEIIASDYRVVFRASCESVAFKSDGVKSVLSMINTESAHAMANAAGNTVMVIIEDCSRYLDAGDATRGEDDQKPLFDRNSH